MPLPAVRVSQSDLVAIVSAAGYFDPRGELTPFGLILADPVFESVVPPGRDREIETMMNRRQKGGFRPFRHRSKTDDNRSGFFSAFQKETPCSPPTRSLRLVKAWER